MHRTLLTFSVLLCVCVCEVKYKVTNLTAMGIYMPNAVTQCYVPQAEVTFLPVFTSASVYYIIIT